MRIAITGTGVWHPPGFISNQELVEVYNRHVAHEVATRKSDVDPGAMPQPSDAEFIEKASGVKRRYVIDREGLLDPGRLRPKLRARPWDEPSIQCEMSLRAAGEAMTAAACDPSAIDLVIAGCSNLQRPYPAIAIEIQSSLGAGGFAYDMNVACSSATFALQAACDAIKGGSASRVLIVNPELCTAHLNFRDRDSHFIFGDACSAIIVEPLRDSHPNEVFEILSTSMLTRFSSNIRNDGGFLSPAEDRRPGDPTLLFKQRGRQVFREVAHLAVSHLCAHLERQSLMPQQLRRLWLHQANATMNRHIATKLLGRTPAVEDAPNVLDEFANTSSAGSIIAFHRHKTGLERGDLGLLCSFGAGYSIGSAILKLVS